MTIDVPAGAATSKLGATSPTHTEHHTALSDAIVALQGWTAADVPFTPVGTIAATDVQGAIAELEDAAFLHRNYSGSGTSSFGTTTNWTTVGGGLSVPAGLWLIQAKGYFNWSTGASGYANTARIMAGTWTGDTTGATLFATSGRMPISLLCVLTFAVTTAVDIQVSTNTAAGTQQFLGGRITAVEMSGYTS